MVGIIDYGMGNIQSVRNAFERIGTAARIVLKGEELGGCDGLVLPGVGAFGLAMANLRASGMVEAIHERVNAGTPLLGICLGLQLLADESDEHGDHRGLGIVPGRVRLMRPAPGTRLPHVGWNEVHTTGGEDLFVGIPDRSAFYFVHSYALECDARYVIATTDFDGPVTAAIRNGSVFATQFHPEKSQSNGFRLLRNFVSHVEARCAAC